MRDYICSRICHQQIANGIPILPFSQIEGIIIPKSKGKLFGGTGKRKGNFVGSFIISFCASGIHAVYTVQEAAQPGNGSFLCDIGIGPIVKIPQCDLLYVTFGNIRQGEDAAVRNLKFCIPAFSLGWDGAHRIAASRRHTKRAYLLGRIQ